MKTLLTSIFLLLIVGLYSQNFHEFRTTAYCGFASKGYSKGPPVKPGYVLELSYGTKLNGSKDWHQYYKYPKFFVSTFIGYPGNEEYGYFIGLVPQFLFDRDLSEKWSYYTKIGVGITYHTNSYDRNDNPLNMLVGSAITGMGSLEFGFEYDINNKSSIGAALGIIHFSNGHVQLPNLGMNFPVINLNYTYQFKDYPEFEEIYNNDKINKPWNFFVTIGVGLHEFGSSTKPTNGLKYLVQDYSFGFSKRTSQIHKFSLGVNVLHYNSFNKFIIYQELDIGDPFLQSSVVGIFGAHEFKFGRFGFYSELGIDIYKPFYRYSVSMYGAKYGVKDFIKAINSNKMGLRYDYIKTDKFCATAGINLKVNMAQADFIEILTSFEF